MESKRKITKYLGYKLHADFFSGSLDELIKKLKEMKKKCENDGFSRIVLERDYNSFSFSIKGLREETDAEFQNRIERIENKEKIKREKANKRQKDRYAKYLQLKKEFEN